MYKLKLKHHFCAAHQLTNAYSEECNNSIHGHNFKVIVNVTTDRLEKNMVTDFKIIKEEINKLDHKNLNEILDFEPTSERIAKYLYDHIYKRIWELNKNRLLKIKIEVFETNDASITYFL